MEETIKATPVSNEDKYKRLEGYTQSALIDIVKQQDSHMLELSKQYQHMHNLASTAQEDYDSLSKTIMLLEGSLAATLALLHQLKTAHNL